MRSLLGMGMPCDPSRFFVKYNNTLAGPIMLRDWNLNIDTDSKEKTTNAIKIHAYAGERKINKTKQASTIFASTLVILGLESKVNRIVYQVWIDEWM